MSRPENISAEIGYQFLFKKAEDIFRIEHLNRKVDNDMKIPVTRCLSCKQNLTLFLVVKAEEVREIEEL